MLTREEAIENLRTYRASALAGDAARTALDCVAAGTGDPRTLCLAIELALESGSKDAEQDGRIRESSKRKRPS